MSGLQVDAVLFAVNLDAISRLYRKSLGLTLKKSDRDHTILSAEGFNLFKQVTPMAHHKSALTTPRPKGVLTT